MTTATVSPFRVWWIPQVPMKPFYVEVESHAEAALICEVLANYDLFQFENNIKPDYSNVGGIAVHDTEEGWLDCDCEECSQ